MRQQNFSKKREHFTFGTNVILSDDRSEESLKTLFARHVTGDSSRRFARSRKA